LETATTTDTVVRYPDVAVLASAQQDPLLTISLYRRYLAPLNDQRKGGRHLRDALRAYLSSGLSSTSAAALLHVDRRTIHNRLARVEDLLGQPPRVIATELALALRMYDAGSFSRFED
jgi:DNA-binding PucR family transcriptional regulator